MRGNIPVKGKAMQQQTFTMVKGFEIHNRKTRKEIVRARMERLAPYYPKAGKGRLPSGLERMLRMYFLANGFNLADEAREEALYDVPLFRAFCRIDLNGGQPLTGEARPK
jgi:hypothetical protein